MRKNIDHKNSEYGHFSRSVALNEILKASSNYYGKGHLKGFPMLKKGLIVAKKVYF